MTKEIYTIELDRSDGVSVRELIEYIKEAVETWGGQRRTDDPLFYAWYRRGCGSRKDYYSAIRVRRRYP